MHTPIYIGKRNVNINNHSKIIQTIQSILKIKIKLFKLNKDQREQEQRYHAKLLILLQIIEFAMKGFEALSSSLNPKNKTPNKGDYK